MRHGRARKLLPALLDQTLPPLQEAALRAHAEACPRCGDELAELRAAEALLRRLPASLLPLEPAPEAELRLAALARWTRIAEPLWGRRVGLSAVGAFAAAAALALVLTMTDWSPVMEEAHTHGTYASAFPDLGYMPRGWR